MKVHMPAQATTGNFLQREEVVRQERHIKCLVAQCDFFFFTSLTSK